MKFPSFDEKKKRKCCKALVRVWKKIKMNEDGTWFIGASTHLSDEN